MTEPLPGSAPEPTPITPAELPQNKTAADAAAGLSTLSEGIKGSFNEMNELAAQRIADGVDAKTLGIAPSAREGIQKRVNEILTARQAEKGAQAEAPADVEVALEQIAQPENHKSDAIDFGTDTEIRGPQQRIVSPNIPSESGAQQAAAGLEDPKPTLGQPGVEAGGFTSGQQLGEVLTQTTKAAYQQERAIPTVDAPNQVKSGLDFDSDIKDVSTPTAIRADEAEQFGMGEAAKLAQQRGEAIARQEAINQKAQSEMTALVDSAVEVLGQTVNDPLSQTEMVNQQAHMEELLNQTVDGWVNNEGANWPQLKSWLESKGLAGLAERINTKYEQEKIVKEDEQYETDFGNDWHTDIAQLESANLQQIIDSAEELTDQIQTEGPNRDQYNQLMSMLKLVNEFAQASQDERAKFTIRLVVRAFMYGHKMLDDLKTTVAQNLAGVNL